MDDGPLPLGVCSGGGIVALKEARVGDVDLIIVEDAEELACTGARRIARAAREAVDSQGHCSLALAEGSTPRSIYEKLRLLPDPEGLPWEQIEFDSADWKRSSEIRRGFMIEDLMTRDLASMTRAEIIGLLGKPTPSDWKSLGDLVWDVGTKPGNPSKPRLWLVIDFDPDGNVTGVTTY